jgi:hypothetical protein
MSAYRLIGPNDVLDWQFDWSAWLGAGDTILAHQWSVRPQSGSPAVPVLAGETTDKVIVSQCERGRIYRVADRITSAAGLVAEQTLVLRCE